MSGSQTPPVPNPGRRAEDQRSLISMIREFFQLQAAGGIILILTSMIALIIANTPLYGLYSFFLDHVQFRIGFSSTAGFDMELNKSILLWINDGIMAIFFFLIGLEIKREMMEGELSSRERALLPAVAAFGGVVVPALIYAFINMNVPANLPGWAIPTATDIAFAICVIALTGSRVPMSLKILLMAIAVIDDLCAIVIIAVFYGHGFNAEPLMFAALALIGLFILNRKGVSSSAPYILLGVVLWVAILKSGVHATLAGVITALFVPLYTKSNKFQSPSKTLEKGLHPWVAFLVLPLFGFANAGVPFTGMDLSSLLDPLTLGIILGLLIGKPVGIFLMLLVAIRLRLSPMPEQANWVQLFGLSILCGIGFTMSLFIGGLAFHGVEQQAAIRLGVLVGSVVSATIGYCLLRYGPTSVEKQKEEILLKRMVQQVDFALPSRDR